MSDKKPRQSKILKFFERDKHNQLGGWGDTDAGRTGADQVKDWGQTAATRISEIKSPFQNKVFIINPFIMIPRLSNREVNYEHLILKMIFDHRDASGSCLTSIFYLVGSRPSSICIASAAKLIVSLSKNLSIFDCLGFLSDIVRFLEVCYAATVYAATEVNNVQSSEDKQP